MSGSIGTIGLHLRRQPLTRLECADAHSIHPLPSQLGFTRVGQLSMSKSDRSDFDGRGEEQPRSLTSRAASLPAYLAASRDALSQIPAAPSRFRKYASRLDTARGRSAASPPR